ncbi:MAG: MC/SLC25 family protein [Candidatus Neomarinimicrobiota bacterium]
MWKDLINGGLAAVISRTATAPLELYKIQCQNRYMNESTLTNVVRKEGVRYLWKGNGMNSARAFPQYAINYAVFENAREKIFNNIERKTHRNFLSGGLAGFVAMTCIYPLETIRTRLSLQMCHSHYANPWTAFRSMSFKELYGGLRMSLLGFGPFSALSYSFYHKYKDQFASSTYEKNTVHLLSGGLAGMSAITITYPSDLIRRRLQMQGFDSKVPQYDGIYDCLRKMYRYGGIREWYRGLLPTYARIFPCLAIQFWCLEMGKQLLTNV